MAKVNPNDNDTDVPEKSDEHGQAAMLLAESVLHGLIARSVITVADAFEIVSIAAAASEELSRDQPKSAAHRRSTDILERLLQSLAHDLPTFVNVAP